ncbi:MAG: 2,3-bisphosphoglycerate-dependent phosphoglycerate mutase [Bacteroidota bacterium]|nr:2,3-bisphosphoglycerate-dependent phosphoglycerate mutase [Bacteroidota bacterium]MDP4233506.1 2,3-bisphosphoglycerate-dependent phosphoglycerate mutase [Bacteroidota bacterium]MDP4243383.1 2,3-bisphosphoglycerate-dependent phosphoglycerate mutase [Bacteroidota bacterium]MDP4287930.1 2,3-bisphosphoglycerate-dependent phosphoglycerate mutase [Bacteroidota bacterium]
MGKLILLRHGESQWNLENRFTGWVDIPLTDKGRQEALEAGRRIKNIPLDRGFTSVLIRAIESMDIALRGAEQTKMHYEKDKALNERMYGDLQGLNKEETAKKYGAEQVHIWRRSYDVPPPNGESLKDTAARTLPYFRSQILPLAQQCENILIVAHGNSLRSIVMELDQLSKEEVLHLNLATGVPIVYDIDPNGRVLEKTILEPAAESSVA